ncbi:hypothetical protein KBI33_03560 [Candidatus Shapirobacteria bacterium]|nr:hypothetical protein [Candidatus Shapirobacteria bacterium]
MEGYYYSDPQKTYCFWCVIEEGDMHGYWVDDEDYCEANEFCRNNNGEQGAYYDKTRTKCFFCGTAETGTIFGAPINNQRCEGGEICRENGSGFFYNNDLTKCYWCKDENGIMNGYPTTRKANCFCREEAPGFHNATEDGNPVCYECKNENGLMRGYLTDPGKCSSLTPTPVPGQGVQGSGGTTTTSAPGANPDCNQDGEVNAVDISLVVNHFRRGGQGCDLNNDGETDERDYGIIIEYLQSIMEAAF